VSVKSFRTFVRRLTIVATATSLGTAAVIALSATPAYAHTVSVSGSKRCVDGNWVVTWTVANSETNKFGVLTAVSHTPPSPALSIIVQNAQLPKKPGVLTETVTLPGSTASASLTVTADWERADPKTDSEYLTLGGDCVPPPPQIEVDTESDCDEFSVTVTNTGTVQASGTVTPNGGAAEPYNLAPGANQTFTYPAGAGVGVTVALGNRSDTYEWKDPGDCPVPTTPPATTPPTTTTPPLPVTGASLTSLIGIGGALVLVGGALLIVLRRRRRLGES
jgi:LPXTG-motif cell wall-anchored protein